MFGSFAFVLVRTSGLRNPETTIIFHFKLNPPIREKKEKHRDNVSIRRHTYSARSLSRDTFGMSVIANPSNYGHFFCLNFITLWESYFAHFSNQSPDVRACVRHDHEFKYHTSIIIQHCHILLYTLLTNTYVHASVETSQLLNNVRNCL